MGSVVVAHGLQSAGSVVVLTGLVAPRHVGSSWTRDRTRVPCIGRQTLNHCATREAPGVTVLTSALLVDVQGLSVVSKHMLLPLLLCSLWLLCSLLILLDTHLNSHKRKKVGILSFSIHI